jgi:hypothetical protein
VLGRPLQRFCSEYFICLPFFVILMHTIPLIRLPEIREYFWMEYEAPQPHLNYENFVCVGH